MKRWSVVESEEIVEAFECRLCTSLIVRSKRRQVYRAGEPSYSPRYGLCSVLSRRKEVYSVIEYKRTE